MGTVPFSKRLADIITLARAAVPVALVWLGLTSGESALPVAVYLLMASWTSDAVDGALARRSGRIIHTWLGDHDLEIDMSVSVGLLAYLVLAGLAPWKLAAGYLFLWVVIFLLSGADRSLGMLFQAPIYGLFIWIALVLVPTHGRWLVAWIIAAIAVTWPRFPNAVIPAFLAGIRGVLERVHLRRP